MSVLVPYEKYKDSGVEWLGEVPEGWEMKPLKYVVSCNDEVLSEVTAPDFEIEYIEISDVDIDHGINNATKLKFSDAPSRARRIIRKGDVIVSTVRTYLRAIASVFFRTENHVVSTGFAVLRPQKIDSGYLKYLFHTEYLISEIIARSVGVSYPAIHSSEILRLSITLPPYQLQQAIADYLDTQTKQIDTLVQEQKELITLLKEKRQALISHCVTKGLDPNAEMKDSGVEWLGEVPERWDYLKLKYVLAEPLMYGANASAEFDDREYPRYIRITDISDSGELRDDTFKSLPFEIAQQYLLEDGDILLARSGATVGKSFMFKKEYGISCFAGYLIRVRVNKSYLIPEFLEFILKSKYYWSFILGEQIQATIQNVSGEKYSNLYLCLPPLPEQQAIANHLDKETAKIDTLIKEAEETITLMQEHRSTLISAVVTGKVKVPGVHP